MGKCCCSQIICSTKLVFSLLGGTNFGFIHLCETLWWLKRHLTQLYVYYMLLMTLRTYVMTRTVTHFLRERNKVVCSVLRQSMYALMAKNEELAREMQPVNALHEQMYPFTLK